MAEIWAAIDIAPVVVGYTAVAIAFIGLSLVMLSYYKGRGVIRKG